MEAIDPFAALGLAGNIVQFLDLSGKLIDGAIDVYHATDGATSTNRELEAVYGDLQGLCAKLELEHDEQQVQASKRLDPSLFNLAKSCKRLGQELLDILEDLKAKGRYQRWQSIRQAMKAVWKTKDIDKYRKQLDLYRSQIASRVLSLLT